MKKISRNKIEKQIREEFKTARQWCKQGTGHYYQMMLDTEDGDTWSDMFLTMNDWKEYQSESITSLETVRGYVRETEMGYIEDAIEKLQAAGWDIER